MRKIVLFSIQTHNYSRHLGKVNLHALYNVCWIRFNSRRNPKAMTFHIMSREGVL